MVEEINHTQGPCPELDDWLKRSSESDDMRMDQPHVEPPGSTIEDTTTSGTGAEDITEILGGLAIDCTDGNQNHHTDPEQSM